LRLDEAFFRFIEEEAKNDRLRKAITKDIMTYGTDVMKRAVSMHNTGSLNASE
jgi:hypothetical protein